jgi:hypothetical protein
MRRRAILAQSLVVGILVAVLGTVAAPAAPAPKTLYSEASVVHAFRSVNIKLHGRPAGNHSQPVTAYTAVVPTSVTHKKPWAVQIWVYPDSDVAAQAYTLGIPSWRENGLATAHLQNVIVTVVPKGVAIGISAPAFPMPGLVAKALTKLQQSH